MLSKPKKVEKKWGSEIWMANNEESNYCGKILHIDGGKGTSMHYHMDKHETFYVLKGELELELLDTTDGEKSLVCIPEGQGFQIKQGQPHSLTASIPTDIIEISTFHKDEDSHRLWIK